LSDCCLTPSDQFYLYSLHGDNIYLFDDITQCTEKKRLNGFYLFSFTETTDYFL